MLKLVQIQSDYILLRTSHLSARKAHSYSLNAPWDSFWPLWKSRLGCAKTCGLFKTHLTLLELNSMLLKLIQTLLWRLIWSPLIKKFSVIVWYYQNSFISCWYFVTHEIHWVWLKTRQIYCWLNEPQSLLRTSFFLEERRVNIHYTSKQGRTCDSSVCLSTRESELQRS